MRSSRPVPRSTKPARLGASAKAVAASSLHLGASARPPVRRTRLAATAIADQRDSACLTVFRISVASARAHRVVVTGGGWMARSSALLTAAGEIHASARWHARTSGHRAPLTASVARVQPRVGSAFRPSRATSAPRLAPHPQSASRAAASSKPVKPSGHAIPRFARLTRIVPGAAACNAVRASCAGPRTTPGNRVPGDNRSVSMRRSIAAAA